MRLHQRVADRVRRHRLWSPGDRVAVAVSGGRDSVGLLHLLAASAGLHRGGLSVVTIDHGTRPGSADDAAFVAGLADSLDLPCRAVTLALGPDASEAACREGRHAAFAALDVDRVALAHHRRDQAETSLLGWLRGGGTSARGAMAWRRGRLVRPLLDTGPEEVEAWLRARGLAWREDPTNRDPRFARNRVRHEVLPLLEDVRPGAERALARGATHAAADEALLDALSREAEPWADGWPAAWVADAPEPLVRRALLRRLGEVGSGVIDAVIAAARAGRGLVGVSPRVRVLVRGGRVLIEADEG